MIIGKALLQMYGKIPPLLAVLRTVMLLRPIYPDVPSFANKFDNLLELTKSKDSILSFMASLTIRTLVRVYF